MTTIASYPVMLSPLPPEDGGGVSRPFPIPGCMSDGSTPEEAYMNAQDAIEMWLQAAHDHGRPVPVPSPHLAAEMKKSPVREGTGQYAGMPEGCRLGGGLRGT